MRIVVLSCDKNEDIFFPFKHCLEKYYPNHPEVVYFTETKKNPYYKSICKNYPLNKWTRRRRESLKEIDDDKILLMIDDIFIRNKVDTKRINYACENLTGNIAMFNFEKSFDDNDIETTLKDFKKRPHPSPYEISLMCGLWDRKKLIDILCDDSDPWSVEYNQNTKGYDYYINSGDYIIDWGYKTFECVGLVKGKWAKEIIPFFKKEGIEIDYEKRGFIDDYNTIL